MNRVRYYGPSAVLLAAALGMLLIGPGVMRRMVFAQQEAKVDHARGQLAAAAGQLDDLSQAFREVANVVEPSVVHISVKIKESPHPRGSMSRDDLLRRFFPNPPQSPDKEDEDLDGWLEEQQNNNYDEYNVPRPFGNGSGWVYTDGKHIITNAHVVRRADQIIIKFHDKTSAEARVVGVDRQTDVAVLELIEGKDLHPSVLARTPVEQGDIVFAFGSPFQFEFSMSQGIVSGKGRRIGILGNSGYEDFIQTDAAINPGNSGGPLSNIQGQVIGMNAAIATRENPAASFNGIGFAIPTDLIAHVVGQVIEKGRVERGYLGVSINDLTDEMSGTFEFDGDGVLVAQVMKGTPAKTAGMKRGDIITHLDGEPVTSVRQLRSTVAAQPPGTDVEMAVFRKGQTLKITVKLQVQPAFMTGAVKPGDAGGVPDPDQVEPSKHEPLRKLGFERLNTMTEETAERLRIDFVPGVLVRQVRRRSVAAANDIVPSRGVSVVIITEVQDEPVGTVDELAEAIGGYDLTEGVRISVRTLVRRSRNKVDALDRYVFLKLPD